MEILQNYKLPDKDLLMGRAMYYLSAVYRERKKYGEAEKYINQSMQVNLRAEYFICMKHCYSVEVG